MSYLQLLLCKVILNFYYFWLKKAKMMVYFEKFETESMRIEVFEVLVLFNFRAQKLNSDLFSVLFGSLDLFFPKN